MMDFKDIKNFSGFREYLNNDKLLDVLPIEIILIMQLAVVQAYMAGRFVESGCPEERAHWSLYQWENQDKIDHENVQAR